MDSKHVPIAIETLAKSAFADSEKCFGRRVCCEYQILELIATLARRTRRKPVAELEAELQRLRAKETYNLPGTAPP